ncbi:hypothetical protein [Halalkalibacter alkalisediminis]|uniref:Uncharacterized protein n=1 Tax=Halalkalibacter alkalisediminis TaxID=935616 RepID=A0ABV6NKY3_9BACI|nr:hypothetical protein [Halalkalibacter alkalisediminis]
MGEKIILLIILYTAILLYDGPELFETKRVRLIYGLTMVPVFYLSLIYVFDLGWPNFYSLIEFIYAEPAKRIVEVFENNASFILTMREGLK